MKTNTEQRNRNLLICRQYYRDGLEMPAIAAKHNITKQRVHAILKRYAPNKVAA